jgi:hypothetical protein
MRWDNDPPDESDSYPDDRYDDQPHYDRTRPNYDEWLYHQLILDPGNPRESARQFLMLKYSVCAFRTLNWLQGVFYAYDGICYE